LCMLRHGLGPDVGLGSAYFPMYSVLV
jgi:hypothetical protein